MKRGILLIALVLSMLNVAAINVITGDSVTGKASSQTTNISITVYSLPSNVTIIAPKNKTYIINSSLTLNYTSNGLTVWYNLDGSENYTLSAPTTFSVPEGARTLYLYANNSDNNVSSSSVEFYANTSLLTIIYEEYNGAHKGSSTDFNQYPYEELQEMQTITLENTNYGKIQFNSLINITDDSNFSDRVVDIDTNTNISSNRIEVSPSNLPNFNKPATLWLYGLSYSNPKILKDGYECSSCTKESYSRGTLKFNVTGFSVYSAAETTIPGVPSPDEGGGGGGGGSITLPAIEVEYPFPSEIYVRTGTITLTIKQGDTEIQEISINNSGQKTIKVKVYALNITDYVIINETEFLLEPNLSKDIILEFLIPEELIPDIYLGKIVIETEEGIKEIPVTINVISKKPYFEITTKIPSEFLWIAPGQEIGGVITINNFQEKGEVMIIVEHGIIDENGKLIIEGSENYEINRFLELNKKMRLPKNIPPGNYFFYAKVYYEGLSYSSTSWFYVKKSSPLPYVIVACLAIGSVVLYFLFRKRRKKIKQPKTI